MTLLQVTTLFSFFRVLNKKNQKLETYSFRTVIIRLFWKSKTWQLLIKTRWSSMGPCPEILKQSMVIFKTYIPSCMSTDRKMQIALASILFWMSSSYWGQNHPNLIRWNNFFWTFWRVIPYDIFNTILTKYYFYLTNILAVFIQI